MLVKWATRLKSENLTFSSHLQVRMNIPYGGVWVRTRISTFWFEDFRDRGRLTLESSSSDSNRLYLPGTTELKPTVLLCRIAKNARRRTLIPDRTLGLHRVDNLCIVNHAPEPPTNGALSPRGLRELPSEEAYSSCLITIADGPRQRPPFGDAGNNLEHGAEPPRYSRRLLRVAAMAARSRAWGCRHPSACRAES
ncbi:hypothetical protein CYMTET_41309 [Cymbomonas tetramitiformis]|uniref:Uncharacterized protein n=1 Tax=Cymbomonas tetramitiformis TaxID=36881 RepID=A0AAE0C7F3_9CHLO|nr:hypothetical protein CYMTET_41309 [Cymbomonas tetramitiformis]